MGIDTIARGLAINAKPTTTLTLAGLSLTGSQATPIVDLSATWNTSGTPTGIKLNVTDTASNAASLLIDLQRNGASVLSFTKLGSIAPATGTANQSMYWQAAGGPWTVAHYGSLLTYNSISLTAVTSAFTFGAGVTVTLVPEANDTLALRRGTNAQTFRLYNTFTDASNGEWATLSWSTVANRLTIGPVANGTGTLRSIGFTSHVLWNVDSTYDIGASGANRPRNVWVAGAVNTTSFNVTQLLNWTGATSLDGRTNGNLILLNSGGTDFNRLQFGGPTNSFGAIARDGAGISFVGGAGGSTAWTKVPGVTVASLPAAATAGAGARSFVTDALTPVFGSAVTGGGAVNVPVYSTGSAWNVG